MLVLSQGTGVLALMAARAGAGHVTAVERSRMMYRMAKQAMASNPCSSIHLLDRPLSHCGIQGAAACAAL